MKINELLGKHTPYRKLNKYKLKLKTKPWITPATQKINSHKKEPIQKVYQTK